MHADRCFDGLDRGIRELSECHTRRSYAGEGTGNRIALEGPCPNRAPISKLDLERRPRSRGSRARHHEGDDQAEGSKGAPHTRRMGRIWRFENRAAV